MSTTAIRETETMAAEDFAERMLGVLNGSALALMTSIGHRTGLFDAMAAMEPATSTEIAERAGLSERYVREWLGAMVTGRVISYEPRSRRYTLPREHSSFLTRNAAPDNLAAMAQYVALLGSVEDQVVECFEQGGGVPYSAFPRFQEVMAEDSGQTVLPALLDSILPLVPGLVAKLREGIRVLDIGCGRGRALMLMAREFPASRFTGYDISEEGVAAARKEAAEANLMNVTFEVVDVAAMGHWNSFDLITAFDAIHDQAAPANVLSRIHSALVPGGIFLMQDIDASSEVHENVEHPLGTLLYTISTMHCMTVSLAEDGAGLGTCWGRQTATRMLRDAGFKAVDVRNLPHDIQNCYFVSWKT